MSILIPGMEMPTSCNKCPMHFYEGHGICSCRVLGAIEDDEILKPWKKRRKDCPLVPVPTHGDLIDRDKLRGVMFIGEQCLYSWDEIEDAIDYAPTIIPAEEGE